MADKNPQGPNRFGISQQSLNEIQGIAILFLALAFFLSILSVSIQHSPNLIGPVGERVAQFMIFLMGQFVAYVVPGTLVVWGVTRFRGVVWSHIVLKMLGLLLLIIGACGLLTGVGYDVMRYISDRAELDYRTFQWGGVLGAILITPQGVNIPLYLGRLGTYLALSTMLLIGILLATNVLFYNLFMAIGRQLRRAYDAVLRWADKWERPKRPASPVLGGGLFPRKTDPRILTGGLAAAEPDEGSSPEEPRVLPSLAVESPIAHEAAADEGEEETEEDLEEAGLAQREQLDMFAGYQIPSLDLLTIAPPPEEALTEKDIAALSRTIEEKLASFGIEVRVTHVTQGPVVTLFELQPAAGVKISRIVTVENDLTMALRASRVRIIAPIPGRGTVGIEIPNRKATIVRLREILESREFQNQEAPLLFGVGKTIDGRPYVGNLGKMPHLLIAGATGSGKSVCLNAIICSFLLRNTPDRLRFIMIDPKRVELSVYQGIPHLLAPVVNEPRKSAAALAWVVTQMEERYRQLAQLGVRNIDGYNEIALNPEKAMAKTGGELTYMPHIVIIVDELADLMFVARNEVEENIIRLAQMSRAVGIHLILATQRPSVNVITGIIKANFPCRIAFQVSSKVDSRTILDMNGAEALLGQGDMLFSGGGSMRPMRLQGAYVSDGEVERLVQFITEQGEAMTEEQMAAERAIASVRDTVGQKGVAGAALAEPDEETDAEEIEEGEGPRSIDEAERVLGGERERPPTRYQYAVDDFTAPDNEQEDELSDELYERALRLILESKKASVSLIQRRLRIGYARAGRLMDLMQDRGIVGEYQGSKPRQLLVDPVQYLIEMDAAKRER